MRILLAPLVFVVAGCATHDVLVTSEPRGAFVQVDGTNIGKTPRRVVFDFSERPVSTVTATLPGYFRSDVTVTEGSLKTGELHLVLMEDASWRATTTSEAANAWLRIQSDLTPDQGWQKLVDALTERYGCLEQLDATSGYARTAPLIRSFKSPEGDFKIRTRVVTAVASQRPFVYKLKIECDRSEREGEWVAWGRPFKEDAQLVEELQSRLGRAPAARALTFPTTGAEEDLAPGSRGAGVFCTGCGAKISRDARFCPACGKAQPDR
ncbi:MAG TPA: zinc-ribbon domain-containing protein [Planctomycetota bacterium]|nr:zinc-ribbon domain-containing protein [Planctomycetota bacterium]